MYKILTLRNTILELLLRKVRIGTKWEYLFYFFYCTNWASEESWNIIVCRFFKSFFILNKKHTSRFSLNIKQMNTEYSVKRILWKYSIQSLKTADSILLNLFIKDNGGCDIPHAAYPSVESPWTQWTLSGWSIGMKVHGQCPLSPWTMSTSIDIVH